MVDGYIIGAMWLFATVFTVILHYIISYPHYGLIPIAYIPIPILSFFVIHMTYFARDLSLEIGDIVGSLPFGQSNLVQDETHASVLSLHIFRWDLIISYYFPVSICWQKKTEGTPNQKKGGFHSHGGTPIAGWFTEHPIGMDHDLGGTPMTSESSIWLSSPTSTMVSVCISDYIGGCDSRLLFLLLLFRFS